MVCHVGRPIWLRRAIRGPGPHPSSLEAWMAMAGGGAANESTAGRGCWSTMCRANGTPG